MTENSNEFTTLNGSATVTGNLTVSSETLTANEHVARNIRMQRAAARMTLRDLSELTGISFPALSRLENAQRPISIDAVADIATALKIPIGTLLAGVS